MAELSVIPSIFELQKPIVRDNSIREYDWLTVEEKTSTNIASLTKYEFEQRNTDEWVLPHNSYLLVQCQIKKDGSATNDNVAILSGHSLFSEARYYLNNEMVEDYRYVAESNYVLYNAEMTQDHTASIASNEMFYRETGSGGAVLDEYTTTTIYTGANNAASTTDQSTALPTGANPDFNEGFKKRVLRCNASVGGASKVITLFLPLRNIFSFVNSYNRVSMGVKHGFTLYKNDINNALLSTVDASTYSIDITKMQWFLPVIKPSLAIENQLFKMLSVDQVIPIQYTRRQHEISAEYAQGITEVNWRIASIGEKPIGVFVWAQLVSKESKSNQNNLIPDAVEWTRMVLKYNSTQFPVEAYEESWAEDNYPRLYNAYIHSANKQEDNEAGVIFSYEEFKRLMPVYYFDLSHQEDRLFETGIADLTLQGRRSGNAAGSFRVHALVLYEKRIDMEIKSGRMILRQ